MTKIIRIKGKRVRPGQILLAIGMIPVSYTHLDVYKRQQRKSVFSDSRENIS